MSSSSTLVNVAEDAELRLVRLLAQTAKSGSFVQDCEACIANGDASNLLKTAVKDTGALGALFVLEPAEEAVSAFSLLTALLTRVGRNEEAGLTKLLADAVASVQTAGKADFVARQISMLSVLYNMRSAGNEKCALLARMIQLAGAGQPNLLEPGKPLGDILHEDLSTNTNMPSVVPSSPRIISMLDAWEVPLQDRRDLFLASARGIPAEYSPRKQRFLLLFVDSYKDAKHVDEQGLSVAREAALGAINDPVSLFIHQRSMLSLPLIQALSKNAATAPLHGLLKVFQEGKLDEYHNFVQTNGGEAKVLQPYGLSSETCIRQMRILSLCSLSAEHEEIPYSVVAQTLQLTSEDQVESWVIAAVSSGLLSAKMDQLDQKVMVERCVVRRFDTEQWKLLQARLKVWKKNVGGVIQGLKQSSSQHQNTTSQQLTPN